LYVHWHISLLWRATANVHNLKLNARRLLRHIHKLLKRAHGMSRVTASHEFLFDGEKKRKQAEPT
jgi:hypothetical protein